MVITNTKMYSGSVHPSTYIHSPRPLGNFTIIPQITAGCFTSSQPNLLFSRDHNELGRFSQAHRLEPIRLFSRAHNPTQLVFPKAHQPQSYNDCFSGSQSTQLVFPKAHQPQPYNVGFILGSPTNLSTLVLYLAHQQTLTP